MVNKKLANKYQYEDLLIKSQDPYANAKYEIILEWLKTKKITTILNAGCGSGELSIILAQNGYKVTGFDLDKDYISLASKNLIKNKIKNCHFSVSSIENFKTKSKYDAVIATDVLEHIKNDKFAFEKLTTFTKPGGTIIITVPAGQYLFGYHDEQLGHFRRYSISSFKKIVPQNLKIVRLRFFGFFLIPVALLFSKIMKKKYNIGTEKKVNKKNIIINMILKVIFYFEKNIAFPAGTSLILRANKKL